MKNVGIWIDKEKAYLVWLSHDMEYLETVYSNIEVYRPKGGSGSKSTKWGPQDVVQDSKYLEREKHQFNAYFKELLEQIKSAKAIVIFGPAETGEKFKKYLNKYDPKLSEIVQNVLKADSMTKNEIRKLMREFYGYEPKRGKK